MGRTARKVTATRLLQAVGVSALLALGGCSDFTGQDITSAASAGLGALVGAKPPERRNEEIVLRARSPLVIPPDYNLRPPADGAEEDKQLASDWPEDPDVKAKEVAALEQARREAELEKVLKTKEGRSAALTPDELASGMVPPGEEPKGPIGKVSRIGPSEAMSPDELLRRHRQQQAASGQVAGGQAIRPTAQPAPVVVASAQNTTKQAKEGVQYQEQEVVEPPKKAPPPKKKDFWDRLVFWK